MLRLPKHPACFVTYVKSYCGATRDASQAQQDKRVVTKILKRFDYDGYHYAALVTNFAFDNFVSQIFCDTKLLRE